MSEQIIYKPIEEAKFSKAVTSDLKKVTGYGTSENNDRLDGYEILQDLFLVKKVHEKQNVKLDDSVIKFYSSMFSLPVLYRFRKAVSAIQYSANLLEAVEDGKLPFSSFTNFGHNCIERKQDDMKKPAKYILKITKNQLAELDKFVKKNKAGEIPKIVGTIFNDKIKEFTKAPAPAPKTDFEKLIESLNNAKNLSAKNSLNQSQRLEAQSIHNLIGANLLPVKPIIKPVKTAAKKTVNKTVKKAA